MTAAIKYPVLHINKDTILQNARILKDVCDKRGVSVAAVVKGFNGLDEITEQMRLAGFNQLASSRIPHLKKIKEKYPDVETMAIRIPMLSEAADIISCCDISLNSEIEVIRALNKEAGRKGKIHKVILMRDVGDLREGIFSREEHIKTACYIENELDNIHLYGIGANFSCYGSVKPTTKNLTELSDNALAIEQVIGRKLDIVSGGSTSSIPLLYKTGFPSKVNHIRIGEAFVCPYDLLVRMDCPIDGMSNDTLTLQAEIVELNVKPTYPIGELGQNGFGSEACYEDKGLRKRAILAMGVFEFGDCTKLVPKDDKVLVLGASSDHTIIDIEDCDTDYKVGQFVEFNLRYMSLMIATENGLIRKAIM